MDNIAPPSPVEAAVRDNGSMFQRFMQWTQDITTAINNLLTAVGSGSPEGVLSANADKYYRDTAGPNLYWKSVDDVAGDTTMGWVLIV